MFSQLKFQHNRRYLPKTKADKADVEGTSPNTRVSRLMLILPTT